MTLNVFDIEVNYLENENLYKVSVDDETSMAFDDKGELKYTSRFLEPSEQELVLEEVEQTLELDLNLPEQVRSNY